MSEIIIGISQTPVKAFREIEDYVWRHMAAKRLGKSMSIAM